MTSALAFLALTYLAAGVPFALVVSTLWGGDADIRATGSGNVGATNVARVYGWRLAAPVLLLDVAKGFLPTFLAGLLWPDLGPLWPVVVALVAFLAHCFPVYLDFHGGKGVATAGGALLAIAPVPTALAVATWGVVLGVTGRSSVASLTAAGASVGFAWWLAPDSVPIVGLFGAAIVGTHLANIQRLMRGQEGAVVKPVRWTRGAAAPSTEEILGQGPAGSHTPALWREAPTEPEPPA